MDEACHENSGKNGFPSEDNGRGKDHEDGTGSSLREQQEGLLDTQVVYESGD